MSISYTFYIGHVSTEWFSKQGKISGSWVGKQPTKRHLFECYFCDYCFIFYWNTVVPLICNKIIINVCQIFFCKRVLLYLCNYSLSWKLHELAFRKQSPRGVHWKRCSENMQQIYRTTPMAKCDFNKVVLQLYWNHFSAWVFSSKFAAYFKNTFS